MARQVLSSPKTITALSGRKLALNARVEHIPFSAHADAEQTATFIEKLQPPSIVLVHGEKHEMRRLYATLGRKYAAKPGFHVFMPANYETVSLMFQQERVVKILGTMVRRAAMQATTTG